MPAAAKIDSMCYATVQAAIEAVNHNQTITLLNDTTEKIVIPKDFTPSFTLDLNGNTLNAGAEDAIFIEENGTCQLTIKDSSGVNDGLLTGKYAILNKGSGDIIVLGGRIHGANQYAILSWSTVTLKGGTISTAKAAAIEASSIIINPVNTIVVWGSGQAMSYNLTLPDATSYEWRTSDTAAFAVGPYIYNYFHSYVQFRSIYTVTYYPGTNGIGDEKSVAKSHDVALTLPGATFTRKGYTQTGWATTDGGTKAYELGGSYTANEGITLYPVWTQNRPASGGGTTPPADTTVYNGPSKTNATIWLSGSGLSGNDLLVTQAITSGNDYNAMLELADSGDILAVYDISLKSGRSSTGSAMYLTINLTGQYSDRCFAGAQKGRRYL